MLSRRLFIGSGISALGVAILLAGLFLFSKNATHAAITCNTSVDDIIVPVDGSNSEYISVSCTSDTDFSWTSNFVGGGSAPYGLGISFSPGTCPYGRTCTSTMTVSAYPNTPPGSYDYTVGMAFFQGVRITITVASPPTVALSVNGKDGSDTINYNGTARLSWSVTDADYCTASGDWSGNKAVPTGSQDMTNLTARKDYTLTCTGLGGSSADSVIVYVNPPGGQCTVPQWSETTSGWVDTVLNPCDNSTYDLRCDYGVTTDNISAPEGCTWDRFVGTAAQFKCFFGSIAPDSTRLVSGKFCTIGQGGSGNICYTETHPSSITTQGYGLLLRNCGGTPTPTPPGPTPTATPPPVNNPIGYLDPVNCTAFTGWACDADNYSSKLDVALFNGFSPLTNVNAAIPRGAGVAAQCGGNQYHGFSLTVPDWMKDNLTHIISAAAFNVGGGSNAVLTNSGQSIQCVHPRAGRIWGYVFIDANGNQVRDAGEKYVHAASVNALCKNASTYELVVPVIVNGDPQDFDLRANSCATSEVPPAPYFDSGLVLIPGSYILNVIPLPLGWQLTTNHTNKVISVGDNQTVSELIGVWQLGAFNYNLTNSGDVTVMQGASGSNTITRTLVSGTSQAVNLTVSGLPPGASVSSIGNQNCLPTCSGALTIDSGTAAVDTYRITVTGSVLPSKTTQFDLVINPVPGGFDYSLENSGDIAVNPGTSVTNTIFRTLASGATAPVNIAVTSALPPGVTVSSITNQNCSPNCFGDLTLAVGAGTANATYNVTVTGSPLSRTTTFKLIVTTQALGRIRGNTWTDNDGDGNAVQSVEAGEKYVRDPLFSCDDANTIPLLVKINGTGGPQNQSFSVRATASCTGGAPRFNTGLTLIPGTYTINAVIPAGWQLTTSHVNKSITVAGGAAPLEWVGIRQNPPCDTSFPNDRFHVCYYSSSGSSPVLPDAATVVPLEEHDDGTAIDHSWAGGIVSATGRNDGVLGVWRGNINFERGKYIFHVVADDGVVLDVAGGAPEIDSWVNLSLSQPAQRDSAQVTLDGGPAQLMLKWYEDGGAANVKLWWDFVPEPAAPATCQVGESFANAIDLGSPKTTFSDPAIQYYTADNRIIIVAREGTTDIVKALEVNGAEAVVSSWNRVGNADRTTTSAPKIWINSAGELFVYIQNSADGYIWRSRRIPGGGWGAWNKINDMPPSTGSLNSTFGSSGPSAVTVVPWSNTAYKVTKDNIPSDNIVKLGKCVARPTATLVFPANNSTVNGGLSADGHISIPLKWIFADTALGGTQDRYRIQLITASCGLFNTMCLEQVIDFKYNAGAGPNGIYIDLPDGANTSRLIQLLPNTTYKWRVRLRSSRSDIDGFSRYALWTPVWEFTTDSGNQFGEIRIERLAPSGAKAPPPAGTAGWTSVSPAHKKTGNPALFENIAPGSRIAYASYHPQYAKVQTVTCTYQMATDNDCPVGGFGSAVPCAVAGCSLPVTAVEGVGTKVVFKYVSFNGPPPNPVCNNTLDDEGDDLVDFGTDILNDPGCTSPTDTDESDDPDVPECRDHADNDGDEFADWPADPGCEDSEDPDELNDSINPVVECDNGIDDDDAEDNDIDYPDDDDCESPLDTKEQGGVGDCNDGADNDGDGLADEDDPGCFSGPGGGYNSSDTDEHGTTQCDDGVDNDTDGAIDYPADISCEGPTDPDESNTPQCNNGVDEPSPGEPEDTLVDGNDPGCFNDRDNDESDSGLPSGPADFSISHSPIGTHPPDHPGKADIRIEKSPIPTYTTLTIRGFGTARLDSLSVVGLWSETKTPPGFIGIDQLYYFFDGQRKTQLSNIILPKEIRFHVEKRDIVNGSYIIYLKGMVAGISDKIEQILLKIGPTDPGYHER